MFPAMYCTLWREILDAETCAEISITRSGMTGETSCSEKNYEAKRYFVINNKMEIMLSSISVCQVIHSRVFQAL